jgi:hypothetical protein
MLFRAHTLYIYSERKQGTEYIYSERKQGTEYIDQAFGTAVPETMYNTTAFLL